MLDLRNYRTFFGAVAALLLLTPSGCNGQCDAACVDTWTLTLKGDASAFPAGDYELEMNIDGSEVTCSFTLAAPPGANDGVFCERADGSSPFWGFGVHPTASGDIEEKIVFASVVPTTAHVRQRRDGVVVFEQSFQPQPEETEVCGQTCQAREDSASL